MKTLFISLGGSTDAAYEALCREYWKRMPGSQVLDLKPEPLPSDPKAGEISRALEKEADRILAAIPKQYFLVALCVEGKPLSSEQFADALARAEQNGHPGAAFVVGSSYGLSDRVKSAPEALPLRADPAAQARPTGACRGRVPRVRDPERLAVPQITGQSRHGKIPSGEPPV